MKAPASPRRRAQRRQQQSRFEETGSFSSRRRLADKVSLDVSLLAGLGTGPVRIVEADVKRYLDGHKLPGRRSCGPCRQYPRSRTGACAGCPRSTTRVGRQRDPLVGMRKAIAERMTASVHIHRTSMSP